MCAHAGGGDIVSARSSRSISPYPGRERRLYRVSRPVAEEDVQAILNGQDEYVGTVGPDRVASVHTFGLLEINCIIGMPEVEVRFDPEQRVWASEYLDVQLSTRF